jgi:hypothetical protein
MEKIVTAHILKLFQENGAKPQDIFILGASVKGPNSNIRKMENALSERGIPCHVPMFETDKIDERVINGKVVFSTFHSVKGRQRKYVIVVGFDNGYMDFYARNLSKEICPNTLYVGTTRATEGLLLLENNQFSTDRPLDFLKLGHHDMMRQSYIEFRGMPQSIFYEKAQEKEQKSGIVIIPTHYVTPTDLIKFIPEQVLEEISPLLDKIFIQEKRPEREIEMPSVVKMTNGLYEEVSDLNGIAVPSIYYDYLGKTNKILENKGSNILYQTIIYACNNHIKPGEHGFFKEIVKELPKECITVQDYLYMANVYASIQEKLYFKLKQVPKMECTWLSEEILGQCKDRLDNILTAEFENNPEDIKIEEELITILEETKHINIDHELAKIFHNEKRFRFSARTDLITTKTLWELKCTTAITIDHMLQVVLYSWLWRLIHKDMEQEKKPIKIFNIKTGEILRLEADIEVLNQIVIALLEGKYGALDIKNDQVFIQDCQDCYKIENLLSNMP